MLTTRRLVLSITIALLAGLGAGAGAQERKPIDKSLAPALASRVVTLKLNAVEVAEGVTGMDFFNQAGKGLTPEPLWREVLFGYGFLGKTSGELPGSFVVSMNCAPAVFTPGGSNEMVGGMWTLPVYMDGIRIGPAYMGALYGTVTGGKVSWDKLGTVGTTVMSLNVAGGTKYLAEVTGQATFEGTWIESDKGTTLEGELIIAFN